MAERMREVRASFLAGWIISPEDITNHAGGQVTWVGEGDGALWQATNGETSVNHDRPVEMFPGPISVS